MTSNNLLWANILGGAEYEKGYGIIELQDGCYVLAGHTSSFGAGSSDVLVAKWDRDGTLLWAKTLGESGNDGGYGLAATADGGFIVIGWLQKNGASDPDVLLAKWDSDGGLLWARTLGGSDYEHGRAIKEADSGDFVLTGWVSSDGASDFNALVARLNATGWIAGCSAIQAVAPTVMDVTSKIIHNTVSLTVSNVTLSVVSDNSLNESDITLALREDTDESCTALVSIPESSVGLFQVFGGSGDDVGYYIESTLDGGSILVGATSSYGAGDQDILVAKLDRFGAIMWAKTIGGVGNDQAFTIQESTDNGFVLTGYTNSYGVGDYDALVVKLDASGTTRWLRTLGGLAYDGADTIYEIADNAFMMIGWTPSFGTGGVLIAKWDQNGGLTWAKAWGGFSDDRGYGAQASSDGSLVLTGYTHSFDTEWQPSDILIAKFDGNGSPIWAKHLGGSDNDVGIDLDQDKEGCIVVTGYYGAAATWEALDSSDISYIFIAKLSSGGDLLWIKTISGFDSIGGSIQVTDDGGYVLRGSTSSYGNGAKDLLVAKLSSDGELLWARTIGGSSDDVGSSIRKTAEGNFILAGGTNSFGSGEQAILVAQLNASGWIENCSAMQSIYPILTDITSEVSFESVSFSLTDIPSSAVLNITMIETDVTDALQASEDKICFTSTFSAPTTKPDEQVGAFFEVFGGSGAKSAHSSQIIADGSIVLAGVTTSLEAGDLDVLVMKVAAEGGLLRAWVLGGAGTDYGDTLIEASDGSLVMSGYTNSYSDGTDDALVVKLNSNGHFQWARTLGGSDNDEGTAVSELLDGGFVLTGRTESYGVDGDVLMMKLASDGNLLWAKTLGGTSEERGNAIGRAVNGGFVLTGYTHSFGSGPAGSEPADVLVARLASDGSLLWAKRFGGAGQDMGWSVQETKEGTIVLTGHYGADAWGGGVGLADMLVAKLGSDGSLLWALTIGGAGDDRGHFIQETTEGDLVVVGYTSSYGAGSEDVLVVKLDEGGVLQWARTIGGSSDEVAWGVQQDRSGYVLAGWTQSYGSGGSEVLVAELNTTGWIENCSFMQAVFPTVTDMTSSIDFDSVSLTVSSISSSAFSIIAMNETNITDALQASMDQVCGVIESVPTVSLTTDSLPTLPVVNTFFELFGGSGEDVPGYFNSLKTVTNESIVLTGSTNSYGAGVEDALVIKLSDEGVIHWAKTFGGVSNDHGYGIQETVDGGLLFTGWTANYGAGLEDFMIVKLDQTGSMTWAKSFGGSETEHAFAIEVIEDEHLAVVGFTTSFGAGAQDVLVIKLSDEGSFIWAKTFGGESDE